MTYEVMWTSKFKKDYNHELSGNMIGYRECHIQPDWLLVYKYENKQLVLTLA